MKKLNDGSLCYLLSLTDNDVKEFENYVRKTPCLRNEKTEKLFECYKNPLCFANFETRFFRDQDFVDACKIAFNTYIQDYVKSGTETKLNKKTETCLDLLNMFNEKCELEKLKISRQNRKASKTYNILIEKTLKDFEAFDVEKEMKSVANQYKHSGNAICMYLELFNNDFVEFGKFFKEHPAQEAEKITKVIDVNNVPEKFFQLNSEDFTDVDFIKACHIAVVERIKKEITLHSQHHRFFNQATAEQISDIAESFKLKCYKERTDLEKQKINGMNNNEDKINYVIKEFNRI